MWESEVGTCSFEYSQDACCENSQVICTTWKTPIFTSSREKHCLNVFFIYCFIWELFQEPCKWCRLPQNNTCTRVGTHNADSGSFLCGSRTICKSSEHGVTLKIEVTLLLLHDAQIQTSWISCNMFQGKKLSCNRTVLSYLTGNMSHKESLSPLCSMSRFTSLQHFSSWVPTFKVTIFFALI